MTQKHHQAVCELLQHAHPSDWKNTIEEFWENWITNDMNDGANAHERSEKLARYKQLKKFFEKIELN